MSAQQSPITSARRVISVLFADLVGFTSLSDHLDPEDVALIQQAYFQRARDAVETSGGAVEKFIGDAVVASFGVPHARDDDGRRAVDAALAIVASVAEVAAALHLPEGTLQVRVGVNTGEVHTTLAADGSWQLTGNVMNVAARLQAAADPGSVLLGADTALAAEPAYVLEPVGRLELKGKSEPVPAWRVVEPRSEPNRANVLHGFAAPTLGRERELAALLGALVGDRPTEEVPAAWLVVAPPGAGKTRLVVELAARAEAAGHPVWRIAARAGGGPFTVVRDFLRAALGPAPEDRGRERTELVAGLAAKGWSGARGELAADHTLALLHDEPLDGELADLFVSWAAVLEHRLGDVRTLWIVDDVHLLPTDITGFFEVVLDSRRDARTIVLTSRPGGLVGFPFDEGSPIAETRVLHLPPLDRSAVLDLVDALVGPGVVPRDAADGIADACGGNPLFVEELLRTWVQAGVLRHEPGGWCFASAEGRLVLPSTVHAIYQSQLDDLHDPTRRVATSGSVPGHSFPPGVLDAFGILEAEVGLDELRSLGLLVGPHTGPSALEVYTYRHTLLRDVAYASLPRAVRAELHVRFATWMADRADRALVDELVGTHLAAAHESLPELAGAVVVDGSTWDRAHLGQEAASRLERTADRLVAHQPQRAGVLLEQALELDPDAGVAVTVRRSVALGEARRRAGALDGAMRAFARAAEAGVEVPTPLRVRAALGYEEALYASRLPRTEWGALGLDLIDGALAAVADDDLAARAQLHAAEGRALAYGGDLDGGRRACAAAIEAARACGDDAALASAILSRRAAQTGPHDLDARLRSIDEAVDAAGRAGDREVLLESLRLQYVDLLEAGRPDEADAVRARAEALVDELRHPVHLWYPPMWRAMEALRRGDPDAARLVDAFRIEGERWRYRDVRLVHAVQLLQLAVDQGDPASALAAVQAMFDELPERFAPVLAYGELLAGFGDRAREHAALHATSRFRRLPRDQSWLYLASLAAETSARLGDVASCRLLAEQLRPWAGHLVIIGSGALCLGDAGAYAGHAAAGAGEPDQARALLDAALERNVATGCIPAAERVRAVQAELGFAPEP